MAGEIKSIHRAIKNGSEASDDLSVPLARYIYSGVHLHCNFNVENHYRQRFPPTIIDTSSQWSISSGDFLILTTIRQEAYSFKLVAVLCHPIANV